MPSQIYHVQSRLFPCVTDCQGKVGFHSSFFGEDPGCPLPLASQFVEQLWTERFLQRGIPSSEGASSLLQRRNLS